MEARQRRMWLDVSLLGALILAVIFAATELYGSFRDRLERRVADGVGVQARVVDATQVWVPRGDADRVHVEYDFGGRTYRTALMWLGDRAERDFLRGDAMEVSVDPDEPDKVATPAGGGSEGWLLLVPVHGSSIVVALLAVVLIVRIQWFRGGRRARP